MCFWTWMSFDPKFARKKDCLITSWHCFCHPEFCSWGPSHSSRSLVQRMSPESECVFSQAIKLDPSKFPPNLRNCYVQSEFLHDQHKEIEINSELGQFLPVMHWARILLGDKLCCSHMFSLSFRPPGTGGKVRSRQWVCLKLFDTQKSLNEMAIWEYNFFLDLPTWQL